MKIKMMLVFRSFVLLGTVAPLALCATFQGFEPAVNNCYVPELEKDFCASLHSICRSSPDKLCFAQSAVQCLPESGIPVTVVQNIQRYLIEIIEILVRPPPPPPPPSTTMEPVTLQPQTNAPATRSPYFVYPFNPKPNPSAIQFIDGIIIQTGNIYLDGLISLLASIQEGQIQQILEVMLSQMQIVSTPEDLEAQLPNVEIVTERLVILIETFSIQKVNSVTIEYYVRNLLYTSPQLFQWLLAVVEQIYQILVQSKFTYPQLETSIQQYYIIFETTVADRQDLFFCHGEPDPNMCERYCSDDYGGNWIMIQARERQNPDVDLFDVTLDKYREGFGDIDWGYFMGLDCLHSITSSAPHEFLVELTDASGATALAHYDDFAVGGAETFYELFLGTYLGGAAGDALRSSAGRQFTTRDHDADAFRSNCAAKHLGGWWYENCQKTSVKNFLNGYFSSNADGDDRIENFPFFGVRWSTLDTPFVLVATRMFIRRAPSELGGLVGNVEQITDAETFVIEVPVMTSISSQGKK